VVRIVVTIPIDITSPEDADLAKLEESGVKAKYACVERVMELPNGNTEWRCATSGTAGGSIPDWLVEPTLEKKVAQVSWESVRGSSQFVILFPIS